MSLPVQRRFGPQILALEMYLGYLEGQAGYGVDVSGACPR